MGSVARACCPWANLAVGGHIDMVLEKQDRYRFRNTAYAFARRNGIRFSVKNGPAGLRIERVA